MVQGRLRKLGIGIAPSVVIEIVRHLENEASQYEIYTGRHRPDGVPTASNKTVLKVKKALDAGDLDFVTDELRIVLDDIEKGSDEDQEGKLKEIKGLEIDRDDGDGKFRLEIAEEAESLVDEDWDWSVGDLATLGVPPSDVLEMLQDYDELCIARMSAEVEGDDYTYLIKFRGLERYMSLLCLVGLMQVYPEAPFRYAKVASSLYARGMIANDESMWTSGQDILRYALWKGDEYRKAYKRSLKLYKRTPRKHAQLMDQIDDLLKGDDDE